MSLTQRREGEAALQRRVRHGAAQQLEQRHAQELRRQRRRERVVPDVGVPAVAGAAVLRAVVAADRHRDTLADRSAAASLRHAHARRRWAPPSATRADQHAALRALPPRSRVAAAAACGARRRWRACVRACLCVVSAARCVTSGKLSRDVSSVCVHCSGLEPAAAGLRPRGASE